MLSIRDYTSNDIEQLWVLFFNTIRNINRRDYTQAQVEAWASEEVEPELWAKRMHGISPFVAEKNGVIVGYTDLQDDGLIDHFFVHFQYQGQGIGGALMNHVFEQGKERKIDRYHSHVSITARPFYEHFGFQVVNEETEEVRGEELNYFLVEKAV